MVKRSLIKERLLHADFFENRAVKSQLKAYGTWVSLEISAVKCEPEALT